MEVGRRTRQESGIKWQPWDSIRREEQTSSTSVWGWRMTRQTPQTRLTKQNATSEEMEGEELKVSCWCRIHSSAPLPFSNKACNKATELVMDDPVHTEALELRCLLCWFITNTSFIPSRGIRVATLWARCQVYDFRNRQQGSVVVQTAPMDSRFVTRSPQRWMVVFIYSGL